MSGAHSTFPTGCPRCGDVDIAIRDVAILLVATCPDPLVRFTCPGCYLEVQHAVRRKTVMALCRDGAHISLVPAEIAERRRTGAPRFVASDAVAFALELGTADELASLAS